MKPDLVYYKEELHEVFKILMTRIMIKWSHNLSTRLVLVSIYDGSLFYTSPLYCLAGFSMKYQPCLISFSSAIWWIWRINWQIINFGQLRSSVNHLNFFLCSCKYHWLTFPQSPHIMLFLFINHACSLRFSVGFNGSWPHRRSGSSVGRQSASTKSRSGPWSNFLRRKPSGIHVSSSWWVEGGSHVDNVWGCCANVDVIWNKKIETKKQT